MAEEYKSGYGKRPLWQWIVIYLVIGAVVYGLVYYFVFAKKGGYSYNNNSYMQPTSSEVQPTSSAVQPTTSSSAPSDNIYLTKTDATKGKYMTDFQGMTLYTFDKDTGGTSTCYDSCATLWPAYTSGATAEKTFPGNITVITRKDNSKQFAWKGMPLYYYSPDKKAGDIMGDGIGGVWHIVKM
ncbi:MAG: hypothetical protein PHP62_06055 [Candidatus Moranbacteria bacterium]|nr:hypothetical protein [Candidatus Moranbacteria bacterium]